MICLTINLRDVEFQTLTKLIGQSKTKMERETGDCFDQIVII